MPDIKYCSDVWCSLIKEKIDQGETISLEITTDSMTPLIRPTDKVTVKGCTVGGISPGDIILFSMGGQLYIHRLSAKKQKNGRVVLYTKGDKAYTFDNNYNEKQLYGKVAEIRKTSKTINLEKRQWVLINKILLLVSCLKAYSLPVVRKLKYVFNKE